MSGGSVTARPGPAPSASTSPPRSASDRGSVSVLSAAILVLAGVLCLLSVDVTRVLHARQRAQLAADAAALAAAQELAIPTGAGPSTFAQEYAARNGAALLSCACEPGSSSALVQVRVDVALVFLPGARSITAEARAVVEGADGGAAHPSSQDGPTG